MARVQLPFNAPYCADTEYVLLLAFLITSLVPQAVELPLRAKASGRMQEQQGRASEGKGSSCGGSHSKVQFRADNIICRKPLFEARLNEVLGAVFRRDSELQDHFLGVRVIHL